MNPLSLIKAVAAPILKIIDDAVPDKDLANKLKAEVNTQLINLDSEILKAQQSVVLSETSGGWLQRNWRPGLMVLFAGLVTAHWFGFTPSQMPVETVESLLDIVYIGVGGYIVGRSGEKIASKVADGMNRKGA